MMPDETPTTDVVADAMAALAEHNAENPEPVEETEAPEAEVEVAPAEPETPAEPAAPSKAEEIRRIALERRAKLEESQVRQPQAPPDPLAQFQQDELRQAIEFQRLFARDPMAAIEKAGHDKSALYERLTREALNPGHTQQMTAAEQAAARAEAAENAAKQAREEFQQYVAQQEAQRRYDTYVREINAALSDPKAYPHASRLDEAKRIRYAAEEERVMLGMGYQPKPLELADLVEDRTAKEFAEWRRLLAGETTKEAGSSPGDTPKAGKAGAATTRSSQTLTNDLASQSGPPAEVDYSPEAAERRALLAARELWSSSE